ncbi:hypothetical protein BD560DRAFT_434316 [Blakeslea trispora]|nr:hypothetical protein BD560DRAFT_434316 [Blakeslea trispora]
MLIQLGPTIDNIAFIVQQLRNATTQQDKNLEHINQLHTTLTQVVALTMSCSTTFNRLTPAQKTIINNIINGLDLSEQVRLGKQSMENSLSQLRRNYLIDAESLLRTQLTNQIRTFNFNNEQHLQALRAYRLANQHLIDSDANMTQYFQFDHLRRQLQEITSNYSNTFQQAEIIAQQITLVETSPEGHALFSLTCTEQL